MYSKKVQTCPGLTIALLQINRWNQEKYARRHEKIGTLHGKVH